MPHQIEVDDEVLGKLKEEAEPFVETTPNSVLRRVLGVNGRVKGAQRTGVDSSSAGKPQRASRARPGTLLEQDAYFEPILRALEEKGGRAPTREVLEAVGRVLNGRLTEVDRQAIASGNVRWQNRAQFARLELVRRGLVEKDSPRGVWEITDAGRKHLPSHGEARS